MSKRDFSHIFIRKMPIPPSAMTQAPHSPTIRPASSANQANHTNSANAPKTATFHQVSAQQSQSSPTSDKKYNGLVDEKQFLAYWQKNKTYHFNPNTKKTIYSIDTPPPTMSGKMHIGHACSYAQQDFIARYKRMRGFEVFYPFGTDDNGLPTEKLVQKEKNVLANKMERQAFIDLVTQYIKDERPKFVQDWINIGVSCDFEQLNYSTINAHCRKISQKSFLDLAKKGLVYQKEAPVIWDTVFQTAIAQAELVDVDKKSFFNDIQFTLDDGKQTPLIIATTRPELLGACVAIFAHPDDKKYQSLFGKHATSPLYNVRVPILADEKVNPEKGTGIVMCCTFGDQTDIEWYKKHKLPLKVVIGKDGKMTDAAGAKYARMKVEEARKAIIDDLKAAGLLKNQKEISHVVNVGERSGVAVEIIETKQWYVSYLDKKETFLTYSNSLNWHPLHMKVRLDNWIKGLNWDWSIARQRKYGVPIPVWYGSDGKVYFADESQLPVDPVSDKPKFGPTDSSVTLTPETDVFDTWFTSSSTPIIARELMAGTPAYDKLFPMDLRPQAHEIINFWLFYTLIKTELLYNEKPWRETAISGYVLDPQGEKMSKSKGNTVSPQEIAKKFPADAMRYWAATSKLGEDMPYQEKELVTGNRLINKLWNAAKFVAMYCESLDKSGDAQKQKPANLHPNDEWLLAELNLTIKSATENFDAYEYGKAKSDVDSFFWNIFCDQYLESIKKIHYAPEQFEPGMLQSAQWTLWHAFLDVVKMLAPITPFVTEAIYTNFYATRPTGNADAQSGASIHTQTWPAQYKLDNKDALADGKLWQSFIGAVRRNKADNNLALNTPIDPLMITGPKEKIETLKKAKSIIAGTLLANVTFDIVDNSRNQTMVFDKDIEYSVIYTPTEKRKE